MWYSTCHDRLGSWQPEARCGRPLAEHAVQLGPFLVLGVYRGQSLSPGAVCDGLVCSVCGACQGGLRQDAA